MLHQVWFMWRTVKRDIFLFYISKIWSWLDISPYFEPLKTLIWPPIHVYYLFLLFDLRNCWGQYFLEKRFAKLYFYPQSIFASLKGRETRNVLLPSGSIGVESMKRKPRLMYGINLKDFFGISNFEMKSVMFYLCGPLARRSIELETGNCDTTSRDRYWFFKYAINENV